MSPEYGPPYDEPDDLIDRMCTHGRVYCPEGCHDRFVGYHPSNQGVELFLDLTEQWANKGHLDPWHAHLDSQTGFDGLDEVTESAMLVYGFPRKDENDGWCNV